MFTFQRFYCTPLALSHLYFIAISTINTFNRPIERDSNCAGVLEKKLASGGF